METLQTNKNGIFQEGRRYFAYVNGELIKRANVLAQAEKAYAKAISTPTKVAFSTITPTEPEVTAPRFHVNERFKFLRQTVKMVASGLAPSAVISGSGGLGKSFAVLKALSESGMSNISGAVASAEAVRRNHKTFLVVKGYSTAKGLYRTLFENSESVIVFDDTDAILRDPVALNLLKAALDSYDTRIISWNSEMRGDDDLPRSFIFTGRVIFISNLPESRIDQAIRSRSAVIDVSMTMQETVDRMRVMITEDDFLPEFDTDIKSDAIAFIEANKTKMREINLRTLITVAKVRAADEDGEWERLAEYLTCK